MIKIYNTATKKVEELKTLEPNKAKVYTCGPTVYGEPHIGNWFTFIRYDVLVRTLRLSGLEVNHVMNITDVGHLVGDEDDGEDKIQRQAARERKTAWDVAQHYTDLFLDGFKKLNLSNPTTLAKATEEIEDQIALVKKLEDKGYTYVIDDGVYFDTSKFADYGKMAKLNLEGQEEGARVEKNTQKRNPSDFALWKFSPKDKQRDMEWDSPWGKGFPGWHLECSVMAMKYLGETIDIHGGGIDHIPVHHTNEIAQSEAATGKTFSNYWMHTNFIKVNGDRIAKSTGNTIHLSEIQEKGFSPMVVRLLALESHYRTESSFSWDTLEAAKNRLKDFKAFADLVWQVDEEEGEDNPFEAFENEIKSHLQDDLNTPEALRVLNEVVSWFLDSGIGSNQADDMRGFVAFLDDALGLNLTSEKDISDTDKQLIKDREEARTNKDFTKADEIRDQLLEKGIELRDTTKGTKWSWIS